MTDPEYLKGLLNGGWRDLEFEPFNTGITAHWLSRSCPQIAILRYEPGASAPLHQHVGTETILVLDGSQSDERGTYGKGDMVINPPGTRHSVRSPEGCVVLLHWDKPIEFL